MKKLLSLMAFCSLLAIAVQAHALSITPSGPGLVLTGNQTAQSQINVAISATILGSTELYKQDVGGAETGTLKDSYETEFLATPTDPSGAKITFTGGLILGDPKFLLVKDGNQDPAWYLFNLNNYWNGTETLELSNFWPLNGAISHVTLYGTSTPVPEPGTLLLLGIGMFGLAVYGKRRIKA